MEMNTAARPSFGTGFSAIFRIFTSPGTVYPQVRDGLSVWPGLIVMVIVLLIVAMIQGPVMREAVNASIIEQGGDPEAMGFMGPLMIVSQILGQLFMLLIIGFFYWLALTVSFGGLRFGRVFALTLYTSFIGLLYQVINAIYLAAVRPEISDPARMQDAMLDLSLGALLSDGGFLARFLSQLGLFQIWGLVLMIGGAAVLAGRTRRQAAWPVLIIFLLGTLLAAALSGLGGGFGG